MRRTLIPNKPSANQESSTPSGRLTVAARTAVTAMIVALVTQLLVGVIESTAYAVTIGRLPHPLFPLSCVILYSLAGLTIGAVAAITAVVLRRGPAVGAGIGAGLTILINFIPLVFLHWFPGKFLFLSIKGMAALAAIGITALLVGLAVAWCVPIRLRLRWLVLAWAIAGAAALAVIALPELGLANPFLSVPQAEVTRDGSRPMSALIIVADTLRADRVGAYGNGQYLTPHLDRFAAEGTTFPRSLSTSNHTAPPHASLLTGTYPSHHGVHGKQLHLAQENTTLPEILASRGWATFAVVSNVKLQAFLGWQQGFRLYDDRLASAYVVLDWMRRMPPVIMASKLGVPMEPFLMFYVDTFDLFADPEAENVVDHTLAALDQLGDRPFFALLNFMDPHYPYGSPEEDRRSASLANRKLHRSLGTGNRFMKSPPHGLVEEITRLYDGEIRYLDREIGRLLAALDRRGRMEDTLVIFTSDHGEHFGEHKFMLHANSLFRQLVDVPLLVRLPGKWQHARRGVVRWQPVSPVDVTVTILDALGIESNDALHGQSLLPLLTDEADRPSRPLVAEGQGRRVLVWEGYRAFFEGDELERVVAEAMVDPTELRDLSTEQPELAERARELYHLWADQFIPETAMGAKEGSAVDEGLARKLRDLGYVE